METKILVLLIVAFVTVQCKPLDSFDKENAVEDSPVHRLIKRYINTSLTSGGFAGANFAKMRSKRSYEDDCEKLELCRLHARSRSNFFSAFELYFVNRENARLWDHHQRSMQECNQRYSCYR